MTLERAKELKSIISLAMQGVDEEIAINNPGLFEEWAPGVNYTEGNRVRYSGLLYKVLQSHTSQADWTPAAAPGLFAIMLIQDETTIPDWVQPDSTNAYMKGDKVMFEGSVYESLIDNNVWSPAAYPAGWQLVE